MVGLSVSRLSGGGGGRSYPYAVSCISIFDEELEPLERNPNRMRARACALAGVVKTASDLIDCWLERQ